MNCIAQIVPFCYLLLQSPSVDVTQPNVVAGIYVSQMGSDTNSGTTLKPFKTLEKGILAARKHAGPDTIYLAPGHYALANTITLTQADSNLTIIGSKDKRTVLSGGTILSNWKHLEDNRWQTQVDAHFEQLYYHRTNVNDSVARRYRPRLPKAGAYKVAETLPPRPEGGHDTLAFSNDTFNTSWKNQSDIQVHIFQTWTMAKLPLKAGGIDSTSHIATLAGATHGNVSYGNISKGRRFIIENVKEALSDNGEWYHDNPTGKLTYLSFSSENPTKAKVIYPRLERLITIKGTQNLTIENVSFAHTAYNLPAKGDNFPQAEVHVPAAITLEHATNITLANLTVRNTGGWALEVTDGSSAVQITQCELRDLGAGGIKIGEQTYRSEPEKQTHNVTVNESLIVHGGRVHPAAVGVWMGHTHHNSITHNDISDFYYTAISPGWSWGYGESGSHDNVIAWNHIQNIGQAVLSDMGGIYTLGVSPNTQIHHNLIHDIQSVDYGGWGIYFDEGSAGIEATHNIVYQTTSAPFHQHYGKDNVLRNNILAFGTEAQLMRTRPEAHNSVKIEKNIIIWGDGPLLGGNWAGTPGTNFTIQGNIYWNTKGVKFDLPSGETKGVVADPLFVDSLAGNFAFKSDAVARQIGFEVFSLEAAGRTKSVKYRTGVMRAWPSGRTQ